MNIDITTVQSLRRLNYTWSKVARILKISRSTLYRKLDKAGISPSDKTPLSSQQIDEMILRIKANHPNDDEVLIQGHLIGMGIRITRRALRESIHRVDHAGVVSRRHAVVSRRIYSVPHPNYIWHIY